MVERKHGNKWICFIAALLSSGFIRSQNILSLDISTLSTKVSSGYLKMGNPGPPGRELKVNNQYLTLDGQPILPVMGEMHFSRYPKEEWEDVILKMKANGINIIAFYIIWIHHEEIEGQFDWTGNKDLRAFIQLCQKHDLWVYPRLGPWAHGEVRNGGTPDWVLNKKNLVNRTNDSLYQHYVDRYFKQIGEQMRGLMYKDGGPIVGVQLENEYWQGNEGEGHILWLKKTAQKYGIDVPLYSVTGWGNASIPENEVIPFWGGYPEAPWEPHINPIIENPVFEFSYNTNDDKIGNDQIKKNGVSGPISRYPYFTCELGVGNQITRHRRPVLSDLDGLAIATAKTGSGSNLIGYYIFTGGSNPRGILTDMQEDREETGSYCDYPKISYDFQAAIKETGELAPSYYQVKKFHYFLNEFGFRLAPMMPLIPKIKDPQNDFNYSVRASGNSGFVFGLNYYRHVQKPEQKNIQFKIKFKTDSLIFPSQPINISDSTIFIWPFNFEMGSIRLTYAAVEPLCQIDQSSRTDWFFIQTPGITPEMSFAEAGITSVQSSSGKSILKNQQYLLTGIVAGSGNRIEIRTKQGKEIHVILLSVEEAEKVWLFKERGVKRLFLSNANLYMDQDRLHLFGKNPEMNLNILSESTRLKAPVTKDQGVKSFYPLYHFQVPIKKFTADLVPKPLLAETAWLKTSVIKVDSTNVLNTKFFVKEIYLENPAEIRSASLYLLTDAVCKIEVNNRWINQPVYSGNLNQLDMTGYLKKGFNRILLSFPFNEKEAAFAANLNVEYFNSDRATFSTDTSWLTVEQYMIPASRDSIKGLERPEIQNAKKTNAEIIYPNFYEWTLKLPKLDFKDLDDVYLYVYYHGDHGELRAGGQLIADNFNNFTPWQIALRRFSHQIKDEQLTLDLFAFLPPYPVYFDQSYKADQLKKTGVNHIELIPDYQKDLLLNP